MAEYCDYHNLGLCENSLVDSERCLGTTKCKFKSLIPINKTEKYEQYRDDSFQIRRSFTKDYSTEDKKDIRLSYGKWRRVTKVHGPSIRGRDAHAIKEMVDEILSGIPEDAYQINATDIRSEIIILEKNIMDCADLSEKEDRYRKLINLKMRQINTFEVVSPDSHIWKRLKRVRKHLKCEKCGSTCELYAYRSSYKNQTLCKICYDNARSSIKAQEQDDKRPLSPTPINEPDMESKLTKQPPSPTMADRKITIRICNNRIEVCTHPVIEGMMGGLINHPYGGKWKGADEVIKELEESWRTNKPTEVMSDYRGILAQTEHTVMVREDLLAVTKKYDFDLPQDGYIYWQPPNGFHSFWHSWLHMKTKNNHGRFPSEKELGEIIPILNSITGGEWKVMEDECNGSKGLILTGWTPPLCVEIEVSPKESPLEMCESLLSEIEEIDRRSPAPDSNLEPAFTDLLEKPEIYDAIWDDKVNRIRESLRRIDLNG